VDLKDGSLNKMTDKNYLGSMLNVGLWYRHKKDSAFSWFAGVYHRTHFNTKFPKDIFHLYFYGNKPFAGQTADLSNFNYFSLQYQQLQFGLMKEKTKGDKTITYIVSLSALNGQRFSEIKTHSGSLYTQQDAEYIDMNLYLESNQSDTTHKKLGSHNGIGASTNIEFSYEAKDKFKISFSARDMGFLSWNNKSTSFVVDTNYHFEGVVINNLLDSVYLDLKSEKDFKEGFKKEIQSKTITTLLPFEFNLFYQQTILKEKLTGTLGIKYIANANYIPLIYLAGNYYFNSKTCGGIRFQYGGYSNFHIGISVDKDFGKGIILSAGTAYIDGYILPKTVTGQGAYAGVKKIF
jgi:hypothetical protein